MLKNILKNKSVIPVIFSKGSNRKNPTSGFSFFKKKEDSVELYFGSQYTPRGLKKLTNMGITAIINMRSQGVPPDENYTDLKYLHIPTPENNPPSLEMLM